MRKRLPALLVVLLFISGPGAQFGGSEAGGGDRGIELYDDSDVWTDPLDDLSHVYVPPGGLVRTEVTGGQAQLKAGQSTGWIASSVISAKAGMRYDYVFIDAHTPGNSYINVSILNASEETTEIGFANETIWGFKLQEGPYLSISSISWKTYPDIRIQANLVADGTDRPVLYAWSLHYLGLEVWRDDFLWPGKIADHRGLNFTGDALEVNLTSMSESGGGSYEEFPTIVCSGEYPGVDVFYANAQLTGYEDRSIVNLGAWSNSMTYDDLNGDGYYDLVVEMWVGHIRILWGDSSGTWSLARATKLDDPSGPQEVATGDFDGDGEVDLVVAQSSNTKIYLNKGEGSFVDSTDITIPMGGSRVSTGDLDGDGYDDILVSVSGDAKVFMGGDGGPDTTADITFTTSNCGDTLIEDVDGDGHLDVILGERNGGKANVYLGSRSGPDTTADHSLTVSGDVGVCEAGDLNGDGYTDLIYYTGSGSSYRMEIFEGGPTGWSDSRKHTDITHDNSGDALCVADLDKDGYEDLLQIQSVGGSSYNLKIWFGDNSWPSTPDISKTTGYDNSVVAMVPKGSGGSRAYRGTLTTEPITLPSPYEQKWDMLDLVGSMPMNTTMTVSVLDAVTEDPIAGYEDLSDWNLDLSGIDPVLHRVIQVQVTIASEFNTTTPVLERILVKWMDRRVWRDEFYGDGKVERMLNLDVASGQLAKGSVGGPSPDLIFPSLRGDDYYNTTPLAFSDAGANDYLAWKPLEFNVRGTSAADTADVNNDGYLDIVFSVQQTAARVFGTQSPLYLGGPLGMAATPEHRFDTTGASDVVLEDINADGYVDVVFAQMQKGYDDFSVNSTLYWGSADGWSDTPDVEFATKGASDVEVFDLDNDDDLDLAFACYRDSGTLTDSMVFLQGTNGFCATAPDHTMLTRGATAVAAGDLDNDGNVDLVFANSIYQGSAEIDSYIFWGRPVLRWEVLPEGLATSGATDVKVVDLDGDGRLDIVFANYWDDSLDYEVDSVAYMATTNPREFIARAATMVPTAGATAVAVVDLDGTGWMDLVFSCQRNTTTYKVPSVVYLGGASGWSDTPDIEIPTEGASDVVATRLSEYGTGGYLSVPIAVDDPLRDTGTLHTLRYSANMGASISGQVSIVDSYTLEVLGETSLRSGTNEWDVSGLFRVSE
ncbi:MAG: hypothetical protein GQ558_01890, partial [Thermoplasmata archaeon]|nr:hypothetical protein [Thermoplasmata archaeon]